MLKACARLKAWRCSDLHAKPLPRIDPVPEPLDFTSKIAPVKKREISTNFGGF